MIRMKCVTLVGMQKLHISLVSVWSPSSWPPHTIVKCIRTFQLINVCRFGVCLFASNVDTNNSESTHFLGYCEDEYALIWSVLTCQQGGYVYLVKFVRTLLLLSSWLYNIS